MAGEFTAVVGAGHVSHFLCLSAALIMPRCTSSSAMINQILKVTVGLLLLRVGPQDMPGTAAAQRMVMLVYLVVGVGISLFLSFSFGESVLRVAWHMAMLWLFVWAVLSAVGKSTRIRQSFTALLACDTVLELLMFPASTVVIPAQRDLQKLIEEHGMEAAVAMFQPPVAAVMFVILLLCWYFAVIVHVFRHALEVTYAQATVAALLFPLTYLFLSALFAGGTG